jgi:hypothetical protein
MSIVRRFGASPQVSGFRAGRVDDLLHADRAALEHGDEQFAPIDRPRQLAFPIERGEVASGLADMGLRIQRLQDRQVGKRGGAEVHAGDDHTARYGRRGMVPHDSPSAAPGRLDGGEATPDKVRLMKRNARKPAVNICCGIIKITTG